MGSVDHLDLLQDAGEQQIGGRHLRWLPCVARARVGFEMDLEQRSPVDLARGIGAAFVTADVPRDQQLCYLVGVKDCLIFSCRFSR